MEVRLSNSWNNCEKLARFHCLLCIRQTKKEKTPSKLPTQNKAKSTTNIVDVDEAILKSIVKKTSMETSTKLRFVDPKVLKNEVQKAIKSD